MPMLKISFLAFAFLFFLGAQPAIYTYAGEAQSPHNSGSPAEQTPTSASGTPVEAKPVSKPNATDGPPYNNNQQANDGPKITDWAQAITSVALLIVIVVQACIYNKQRILMWKQWIAMRRGVIQTQQLVKQNAEVVETIKKQEGHLSTQAQAAVDAVEKAQGQLEETRKLVIQNEGVLKAMQRQVEIMGIAVEPKLRISDVRLENFEVENWPIVLVSIVNESATDAKNVSLHIRVQSKEGAIVARKWSRTQIVAIPAHQGQIYPLEWNDPLTQEAFDAGFKRLKVRVTIKIGEGEESKFCYRIYRFKGRPPAGVSQFVPCDFDPGHTYVQTRGSLRLKLDSHTPHDDDEADDNNSDENPN